MAQQAAAVREAQREPPKPDPDFGISLRSEAQRIDDRRIGRRRVALGQVGQSALAPPPPQAGRAKAWASTTYAEADPSGGELRVADAQCANFLATKTGAAGQWIRCFT